jgi:hypothetical protein
MAGPHVSGGAASQQVLLTGAPMAETPGALKVTLCPRDSKPLTPTPDVAGPGTRAEVCPTCAGAMLDWKTAQPLFTGLGLALPDLAALVKKAARRARPGAPAPCTACGQATLQPLVVQAVELDLCEHCGSAWFDRGELARLTRGRLGADLAPAPLAEGETSEVVGVYEMLWDCAYCQTPRLKGAANAFCPSCGAQQDASRRYFPASGEEVAANLAFEGADRLCPACATPNGARAAHCRSCGSPLEGSAEVGRVADRSDQAPAVRPAALAPPGARRWPVVLGVLALLAVGVCGAAVLWKKEVAITVTGHAWRREVDVEQLRAMRDDAWCDGVPWGAYAVSRSREQRSTRQVPDGQACATRDVDRGNGTFERRRECHPKYRDEPVYDERCHFTVDRWVTARTASASGSGLEPPPRWPAVEPLRTGLALGAEREGARRETYTLQLRGADGKDHACSVSGDRWASLAEGTTGPARVGVLTGAVDCTSLMTEAVPKGRTTP